MIVQSDRLLDSLTKTADEILQEFWKLEKELGSCDE